MSKLDVTVIDYGVGNLLSVKRSLEKFGGRVTITSNPKVILESEKVVLPGVGAFPRGMEELKNRDLVNPIREYALKQRPLLAICLGMQLLMDIGEEFKETKGLGLIKGRVIPIPRITIEGKGLKIPHIGWNELLPNSTSGKWSDQILNGVKAGDQVYFVHSFMISAEEESEVIAGALYGSYLIPAIVSKGFITGCQFHPEKSGAVGLKIIENFLLQ